MAGISGLSAGIILAGRYQLSRRLWHRSIGELWLASDTVRRRRVWIQISETGGLENAVSALQRVQHPAIATVREAGQKRIAHEDRVVTDHESHAHKLIHKSDSYIEFAVYDQDKGSSLTARLMKGALTSAEIATVALSVAEVFEQVHGAGLVHGWLHTDSIWLGSKGNIFVDLALGLAYEGTPDSVHAEAATGFISADRLEGGALTASADVYAFSWLLYVAIFGWEIVRKDFEAARLAAAEAGHDGHVHGDGMTAADGTEAETAEHHVNLKKVPVATILVYRREIAVRRVVEFFGEGSELALLFTASLSGEAGPRPTMAEVVEVLRRRQAEVAALPVPAIVAEAIAASAAFAFGAEAAADELAAAVEDADTGAWTPAVSPTAGTKGKTATAAIGGAVAGAAIAGMVSLEECESSKNEAVAAALAEAEERYSSQTEDAIAVATAAAVAAALAEAEATHADVNRELIASASAAAIAEALAEAEERHAAERESAVATALAAHESRTNELTEAAIAAAVAQALAEVEAAQAQQNEEAIATASAVAVEAALLEARTQHSAELEAARAAAVAELEERHTAEMTALQSSHGAGEEVAIAAAVALAVAELEERHRVEIEELKAAQAAEREEAVTAASAAAVALALAEAEERHAAELAEARSEAEHRHGAGEAAAAAATAAAVAAAIAEAEERHQAELEAARAAAAEQHAAELAAMRSEAEEQSGAGEAALAAASAAAVTVALAEAEERHAAELAAAREEAAREAASQAAAAQSAASSADTQVLSTAAAPPPPAGGTPPAGPGEVPVPKQRPTWLIASGTAVLGLAVGIGIGWSVHHGKSCTTATAVTPGGAGSSGSQSESTAPSTGASSSAGTATDTAAGPTSAAAGVPSASGSLSGTPGASGSASASGTASAGASGSPSGASSGAPSASASASPSAPASPSSPPAPSTPPTPFPTSAQQAESQMSTIVQQQVTNSTAASQLTGAISSIAATKPGSGAYNQAIGQLNGLVTTELNQGQISSSTASALRQQVTYLLSFSGS